ncbi:MAG: hypothetical protein ACPGSO_07820 [Vicingaceae bacterium]
MKKLLYIIPLLLLSNSGFSQEKTISEPVKKGNSNFKNQIDLDVELLLSANCSYKRSVSERIALGGIVGLGFPVNFSWNNQKEFEIRNVIAESFNIGPILRYKISEKWKYEFSPQYSVFSTPNGTDGIALDLETSAFGIKNGIYLKLNKVELGVSLNVGYINIGYKKTKAEIVRFYSWTVYNSFLKLRIPLKIW